MKYNVKRARTAWLADDSFKILALLISHIQIRDELKSVLNSKTLHFISISILEPILIHK